MDFTEEPQLHPILLCNIGSPKSDNKKEVRTYLKEFLMDKHIIPLPKPIRSLLVHGIILPLRTKKSALRYNRLNKVTGGRMPLTAHMESLAQNVEEKCKRPVLFFPRYGLGGEENVKKMVLQATRQISPKSITIIPLFPQFTYSNASAVLDYLLPLLAKLFPKALLYSSEAYYNHPIYIEALAKSIHPLPKNSVFIFSYHGIPLSHHRRDEKKGFPAYRKQCETTTKLLVEKLGLAEEQYFISFQSKMGHSKWEKPYTEEFVLDLIAHGIRSFVIVTPGFSCDCLETLDDIAYTLRPRMMSRGAVSVRYVPALNSSTEAVRLTLNLINEASILP